MRDSECQFLLSISCWANSTAAFRAVVMSGFEVRTSLLNVVAGDLGARKYSGGCRVGGQAEVRCGGRPGVPGPPPGLPVEHPQLVVDGLVLRGYLLLLLRGKVP
jgi:hypothetical protein